METLLERLGLTISLENAVVYDIETLFNAFTLNAQGLFSDFNSTWEISPYRDDRQFLFQWFDYLNRTQTPMIGFNNLHFDYPVIHFLYRNPTATFEQIYNFAMNIISSQNRFANMIWESDRFAPQIDLFKIHHFDNKAKTTSLKALQINMRAENVVEVIGTKIKLGVPLTFEQVNNIVVPYNGHDVQETKRFAHYSKSAIDFRIGLVGKVNGDVLNFNDTKIGAKILEQRIGEEICYTRNANGRREARQTIRTRIALNDIIFPYIQFSNSEFDRVLNWMKTQVLTPEDIEDPEATVKTKGVFKDVKANVGDIDFHFGTGGIHGSVSAQKITETDDWKIIDIDVASLYPSIAIVNNLSPAHLGEAFVREYAELPKERKRWQQEKGKKCVEANSLKLAANGTYGNSNSKFSVFYDPQFTLTITINGQLSLCMLAEWLLQVPTLKIIQINTDGITYFIHKLYIEHAEKIQTLWEQLTKLTLESANYSRMWIRDVNNYIAENKDGSLKQKGAYWHPDPLRFAESISEAQPPAWHKDFNPVVVTKAAVAAMVNGIPPEQFIPLQHDKFDFMLRAKVDRSSKLMIGETQVQSTCRYYISKSGQQMFKISPPPEGYEIGQYKRASKISDLEYKRVMSEIGPNVWDERIHTKNKSKYEDRKTAFQSGWNVKECNNVIDFSFDDINYDWYINEAKKLIIN